MIEKSPAPLFGTLSIADEHPLPRVASRAGGSTGPWLTVVAPGHWATTEGAAFSENFERSYGEAPPAVAAYAYDGAHLIIEAIRTAGLDRQRIRDALSSIDLPRGATGPIRFDENGNRVTTVKIRRVSVSGISKN